MPEIIEELDRSQIAKVAGMISDLHSKNNVPTLIALAAMKGLIMIVKEQQGLEVEMVREEEITQTSDVH